MFKRNFFLFLDTQLFGDGNKKMKAKEQLTIEMWLQTFDRVDRLGLGIRQYF